MNNNNNSSSGTTCPQLLFPQNLPVGWRFHPSDEELVDHYLKRKRLGEPIHGLDIGEEQVCDYYPWDLPGRSKNKSRDKVWYFFCPRQYHKTSGLPKRKANSGYWKSTGDLRVVTPEDSDEEIGTKRTLVFHNPDVTPWVIHEYEYTAALESPIEDYVLCKLKISNKKKKACKKSKKAEQDCKKMRPNKKARKGESNSNLASASTSENEKLEEMKANSAYGEGEPSSHTILDLENQNLNKMASISTCNQGETISLMASNFDNVFYKGAAVSTCNEGETSFPVASDLENHSPKEITAMSSYNKVKPSCPRASVLENQSPNEITTLSTNNKGETSCFRTFGFENQNSNAFEKGKQINLVTSDFEKQNPNKNMDILASIGGEQIPTMETPSVFVYQNHYKKIGASICEDHWSPSMTSNVGETTCKEVQSKYKKTTMPISEDCLGSWTTSNVQEAMFQVQSQYKKIVMPTPEDNSAPLDAETTFPELSSQELEEIIAYFELQDCLNSAPQLPISDKEGPGSN